MINGGRQYSNPKEMKRSHDRLHNGERKDLFIGQYRSGEVKEKPVNVYDSCLNPFRKENKNGS